MNASEMIRNADHSYAGVVSNISRQKKHQEYQNKINKKLFEDRANSIIEELSKYECESKNECKPKSFKGLFSKPEGLVNFEYSPYCKKNILDERDLSDCEGFNRGVILKLELK